MASTAVAAASEQPGRAGGGSIGEVARRTTASGRSPVLQLSVEGTRQGSALYVEIRAHIAGQPAGTRYEDVEAWRLRAASDGKPMPRLVNGSTAIDRREVGGGRWDITVTFSTAFRLPRGSPEAEIWVAPPGMAFERFPLDADGFAPVATL